MEVIKGFKAFNKGLISNYNIDFKENTWFHTIGEVVYRKNGFHFCENMEDTLKYYPALHNDIDIARILGAGTIVKRSVEGYSYDDFDICIASDIKILDVMTREEIIEEMNSHQYNIERMKRFISLYKLTDEEIEFLRQGFEAEILNRYVEYYQYGDKNAFERKRKY